jgi:hypothetical protein
VKGSDGAELFSLRVEARMRLVNYFVLQA